VAAEIWTWHIKKISLKVQRSALAGTVLLWSILSWVGWRTLHLSLWEALQLGQLATIAHWALDVIQQLGHARAANRTGYPMIGIRFWWVLSSCLYPVDEPELPIRVHTQRALGGPKVSFAVLILALVWCWWVWPLQGTGAWLAMFVLIDSLLTFTLGAFLPLGFTDGSTLWRLQRKQQ
jgi:hypothetical protein